ncbi:hypothetical protein CMV_014799 [Castanea mollissima]|uniref:F-box domain-containing protein n=1 Tax=Castanea mollissima TaxID=60419 RepID=A0A8J4RBA6_9ROSI|nr:hypothetical protein CMV_014799 [Castanea mollissima]
MANPTGTLAEAAKTLSPPVDLGTLWWSGKCVSEDYISNLSSEILVSILSQLTLREAVATSILRRRWRYLWTSVTILDFDATKETYTIQSGPPMYVKWVDRVLGQYEVSTINEIRISFDLDQNSTHAINSWIEFAMTRELQRLEMDLLGRRPYNALSSRRCSSKCKRLWRSQSCGPSREQFCLNLLSTRTPTFRGYKFLKDLYLKNVGITQEVIEHFLANCPKLE